MASGDVATTRVSALREGLAGAGLDALLVTNPNSRRYLVGLPTPVLGRFRALIVSRTAVASLAPDPDHGAATAVAEEIVQRSWRLGEDPIAALVSLARDAGLAGAAIGIEDDHLTVAQYKRLRRLLPGSELMPAAALVHGMRMAKSKPELAVIRRGASILADTTTRVLESAALGDSEIKLQTRLVLQLKEQGIRSIRPQVQFSEHSARPGTPPTTRELRRGDVILIDVAATEGGYWADICRWASVGPPAPSVMDLWTTVGAARQAVLDATRAGVDGSTLDAAARAAIESAGHTDKIRHLTGHGIGLEVHEPPFLEPASADVLVEGAVFTIEPGLFVDDAFGVRREDNVVVVADGAELLSAPQHEPIVL
jgi:Xaa-Pro dipeptidase